MRKAKNFLGTWRWLLSIHFSKFRTDTILTIALGIATRINTIAGFVATIKCVIWMADRDGIPSTLRNMLPTEVWIQNAILIAIPSSVFLMQAFLQLYHEKNANNLHHRVANELTMMALKKNLMESAIKNSEATNKQRNSSKLKTHYNNVMTIEAKLINIFSMSIVLTTVILAGFFINWKVMSLMTSASMLAALLFFLHQHKINANRRSQAEEAQSLESHALQNIDAALHQEIQSKDDSNNAFNLAKPSIKDLQAIKNSEKSVNIHSNMLLNSGQAFMVTMFLVGVLQMAVGESPLSWIAILAIIFRFALGYAQAIVRDVSYLISNHQKLVHIRLSSSITLVESNNPIGARESS